MKINEKRSQLSEEELKTQDPEFWNDSKKAELQMKSIRSLKYWIEAFDELKSEFEDIEILASCASISNYGYEQLIESIDMPYLTEKLKKLGRQGIRKTCNSLFEGEKILG